MKKINILYWISTGLIALLMLFSAVQSIINGPDAVKFITGLQYPAYFNPYLGVWKVLGVIALLVPGFPKIREWAYAGFTIDLISAIYSFIAVKTPASQWAPLLIFLVILAVSYYYNQKRQATSGLRESAV